MIKNTGNLTDNLTADYWKKRSGMTGRNLDWKG